LTCPCDAAAIRPRANVTCNRQVGDIEATAAQYDLAAHDYDVAPIFTKRGHTTGLTEGILIDDDADFEADSPVGPIYYPSGLLIDSLGPEPFARSGDSGAVVVDEHGSVLGLVVAMTRSTTSESARAFCLRIETILNALEVDLIGPG
jgi:hypothetical protein